MKEAGSFPSCVQLRDKQLFGAINIQLRMRKSPSMEDCAKDINCEVLFEADN